MSSTELQGNVQDALELRRHAIVLDTFDRIQLTSGKGVYFGETTNDTAVVMERVKLSGNMEVSDALFVGNLTVAGNIKLLNQNDVFLENNYIVYDKTIVLANTLGSSSADGAGLYIGGTGSAAVASLAYKHSLRGLSTSQNLECLGNVSIPNLPARNKPARIDINGNIVSGNIGLYDINDMDVIVGNVQSLESRVRSIEVTTDPVATNNRFANIEANVSDLKYQVENLSITSDINLVSAQLGVLRGNINVLTANVATLIASNVASNVRTIETRLETINQYDDLNANIVYANTMFIANSFVMDGAFTANGINCQGNLTVRNPRNPYADFVKFYPSDSSIIFGGANIRINGQATNRYMSMSEFEEVRCENRFVVANTMVASDIVGNNASSLNFYTNVPVNTITPTTRPTMTVSDAIRDVYASPVFGQQGLLNRGKARLRVWNMNTGTFSDTTAFIGPATTIEFPETSLLGLNNVYTFDNPAPYCFSLDAWYVNLNPGLYCLTWTHEVDTSLNINGMPQLLVGNSTRHIPVYVRGGHVSIQCTGTRGEESGGPKTMFAFKLKYLTPLAF